jgi:hypothetical protein
VRAPDGLLALEIAPAHFFDALRLEARRRRRRRRRRLGPKAARRSNP